MKYKNPYSPYTITADFANNKIVLSFNETIFDNLQYEKRLKHIINFIDVHIKQAFHKSDTERLG